MQLFKSLMAGAAFWAAASAAGPVAAAVVTTTDDIPASARTYTAQGPLVYLDGPNIYFIAGAVLGNFSGETETPVGPGIAHIGFSGELSGSFSVNFGPSTPLSLSGPLLLQVGDLPPPPPFTQDVALEMLQMDLAGGGIMVREHPALASTGHETHQPIGGGLYQIDSFFDVFTELSIDGGNTWIPSAGQTRFDLSAVSVPEPLTAALFGLGLLGVAALRRRNG